ncbi:MAG: Gmad2 immunoglobulin-like domain-containing protein [Gammaproteobacteria bacterium]|nr:Gmad2 immunoglobulin-like domain-containing protein [Gammaproteobacteria bacterium]MDH4314097.1 Gmad2 immunoglobulin-like domain-containing protein [Gammaproteobacteria bacterium]MDH5213140.1 Gmad2 immunoglobulin-like domain-containing protein [Gammaproteobacteria bacterium]
MLNAVRTGCRATAVILAVTACSVDEAPESGIAPGRADAGPLNTTYGIDGSPFTLRDGRFEMPAAPDSAAKITLKVFGAPAYGELDDDRETDAAVILVYQGGGSGTFYYLAAALGGEDGYRGTNALLLGDRVTPQFLRIQNRAIAIDFRDRGPAESFATAPTIDMTHFAILDGQSLIAVPSETEQSGWVTYGHEVRTFAPCDRDDESWLLGQSPALPDIRASYEKSMSRRPPYAPLFMVLAGSFMDPPHDGFGADHSSAFFAAKLVEVNPAGNCRDEFVSVETPLAGAIIESPLIIKGRARGTWFFEGDFPVALEDAEGNELSRSFLSAQGEWMTKEFVPFTGTLSFTNPVEGLRGRLIFRKDNPTDRPELDDSTAIPVIVGVGSP